jgi:hypothetical protein
VRLTRSRAARALLERCAASDILAAYQPPDGASGARAGPMATAMRQKPVFPPMHTRLPPPRRAGAA